MNLCVCDSLLVPFSIFFIASDTNEKTGRHIPSKHGWCYAYSFSEETVLAKNLVSYSPLSLFKLLPLRRTQGNRLARPLYTYHQLSQEE